MQLLRLLTLRGVADPAVTAGATAGDAAVAGCAGVALATWIIVDRLLDRLQWGAGVEFDVSGIPLLALAALLVLALAYLMARVSRPALPMRATLLLVVAPLPLLIVAYGLVEGLLERQSDGRWQLVASLLLAGGLLLSAARSLRALSGQRQLRALLAAALLLAAYLAAGQVMDLRPTLWAPPDDADAADAADGSMPPQVAEALLFDARPRLDAALAHVAASDHGAAYSVFFVGFAGVGSQKVFAQEIKLAARVVGQRFGSGARQLLLINDHRDVDSYPLASVSGLRYALAGIAARMDLQRDILFLALSSHGSEEPLLSVSNGTLPLEQLGADELAAALRDAGIRWRVIVISACYAGAFIEPLKDPDTVLITAAAADRTSFGCSDDRDLTYFGEAFYRDALPRAMSLQDAFALTRAAIATRERSEHVTASDPQAWFGARIAQRLLQQPMRAPAPAR
jgi:hypothetical protein